MIQELQVRVLIWVVSWTIFPSQTPITTNLTHGGGIAASTSTNYVWLPNDAGSSANSPWYTTNGGTTWTAATVGGTVSATAPLDGVKPISKIRDSLRLML